MKTEGSENVAMADPASLIIAYPPIKRIIKLEILEEQQEANSFEEENWTLQVGLQDINFVYETVITFMMIALTFSSPKTRSRRKDHQNL